jgi:uncharacterized protein DUF6184
MKATRPCALLIVMAIPLAACAIDDSRTPETPGYAVRVVAPAAERRARVGSIISARGAADALARARCDREARCDHIGTNEKHASAAVCSSKLRAQNLDRLQGCGQGVDAASLDACTDDVASQSCWHELDDLDRLLACSTVMLCID